LPYQTKVKTFYENEKVQTFIAGLIIVNFVITCTQKEIDPQDSKHHHIWLSFSVFFNLVFLLELTVNLYGRWWCEFWHSNWNRFDFTVVTIGVIDLAWQDMPAQLRLIRMLRAFRVFRLFEHVKSMRKIIESIAHAVPGVANAFLINFILICIYAVLSVDFFSEVYDDCDAEGFEGPATMVTARAKCWGFDYYGTFTRALYTMFQVLTGDSWSEAGARPALDYYIDRKDWVYVVITYIFFYSFVIVNAFVLLNVVVAVLMDGMANSDTSSEEEDKPEAEAEKADEKADDKDPSSSMVSRSELADLLHGIADIQKQLKEQSADLADLKRTVSERFSV
jgi:Na+-transporting methylmalonyl-CoA/oxaloacetate decarboxylase gamma subunit